MFSSLKMGWIAWSIFSPKPHQATYFVFLLNTKVKTNTVFLFVQSETEFHALETFLLSRRDGVPS